MPRGVRKYQHKEEGLQTSLARYVKLKFPDAIFISSNDGLNVDERVGAMMKRQRSTGKHPDMFFFEPRGKYFGLAVELKKSKDTVYKKDGTFRQNKHIQAQLKMLRRLSERGYYACFCYDIDNAMETVRGYLTMK